MCFVYVDRPLTLPLPPPLSTWFVHSGRMERWKNQYLCAKTCGNTKYCEDPNPNKECKNVAPGKILSASYICQLQRDIGPNQ